MDILPHLKHFTDEHLKVHGKTPEARRYLKSSIRLWTEAYGAQVGTKMEIHVRDAWAKAKAR